jgi:hypothetical protein
MGKIDIHLLRSLFDQGRFAVSSHTVPHRRKEGFSIADIRNAVLKGRIIEEYPERERCLVWGRVVTPDGGTLDLHVVCEVLSPEWAYVVTAYVPNLTEWDSPPLRRKKRT